MTEPLDLEASRREEVTLALERVAGLTAEEAERRALAGHRVGELGARVAAFYLADLANRGLYQQRGFASLDQYAKQRMQMAPSTLKEYVRVGRALEDLPYLDRLFCADALRWSHVRAVTRVATPETERAWGEWAIGKPVKEVERQAGQREKGDLPTDPQRRRIHTTKLSVHGRFNPVQQAVWNLWREILEEQVFEGPVSDTEMMVWMAHKSVRELTGEQLTLRPMNPDLDPRNQGPPVPLPERDVPTPKALRLDVRARDGDRCVCCGSKRNLTVHHLLWRRYGGPTTPENLLTLCENCHSLVHDRFLILVGDASDVSFLDSDGQPLGQRAPQVRVKAPESRRVDPTESRRVDPTESRRVDPDPRDLSARVSFNDVPREVDAAWWRRHRHLFSYSKSSGGLSFEPGIAPTTDPAPPEPRQLDLDQKLSSLIRQERVHESLSVAIRAAREAQEPLSHVLLLGAPGLGKTSLASAVANELGAGFEAIMAPTLRDPALMIRQLTSLRPRSVLFLDEVHGLPASVSEVLYDALERGHVDLPIRCGWEQRSLRLRLAPFTLVAATTEEGLLPEPFRSRFVYQEQLSFYDPESLGRILEAAAAERGLSLTVRGRDRLARASRNTPRDALGLLQAASDDARAQGTSTVSAKIVDAALRRTGTTPDGIRVGEAEYLRVLEAAGAPVGLSTLAASLGTPRRNVRRVIEPYLLRAGLVVIGPRGRTLTAAGRRASTRSWVHCSKGSSGDAAA